MPRYFFHIYDDIVVRDDEGMELPDAEAARREMIAGVREVVCEQVRQGRLILHHRVEVEGENGAPLFAMSFGESVTIEA